MAKKDIKALLSRMNQVGQSGGGTGYWAPKAGAKDTVRILPPVGDMDFFFQPVGQHRLPDGKWVICPSFTTDGEHECPICDLVGELYNTGDEDDRETASQIRRQKKYFMNVVVRKDGGDDEGPFIYTPGVTVFQALQTLVTSPDYGDISDEEEGTDIVINREGTGLDTTYSVVARRDRSFLHEDEATMDKWLDTAADLSPVALTDDPTEDADLKEGSPVTYMPYDRIIAEIGVGPGMSADDLEVADRKSKPKAAKRSRGRKNVEGDEDPFPVKDAEPAKAETDDDDDDVGKAIEATKRRRRRR